MAKRSKPSESEADPSGKETSAHSSSSTGAYDRDRVAMRAYELYMARGGRDGADMEDWLIAEREVSGRDSESRGK
jgi:Protein of unknown function (DUF2934)